VSCELADNSSDELRHATETVVLAGTRPAASAADDDDDEDGGDGGCDEERISSEDGKTDRSQDVVVSRSTTVYTQRQHTHTHTHTVHAPQTDRRHCSGSGSDYSTDVAVAMLSHQPPRYMTADNGTGVMKHELTFSELYIYTYRISV